MKRIGIAAVTLAAVLGTGAGVTTIHAEIKGIDIGQGNFSGDGTSGTPLPNPPSLPTLNGGLSSLPCSSSLPSLPTLPSPSSLPGYGMLSSLPGADLLIGLLGAVSIGQGNFTGDGTIIPLPAPPSLPGVPSLPSLPDPSSFCGSLPTAPSLPSGLPSLPSGLPSLPSGLPSLPTGMPSLTNLPTSALPPAPSVPGLPPLSSSGQLNGLSTHSVPTLGSLPTNWMFDISGL